MKNRNPWMVLALLGLTLASFSRAEAGSGLKEYQKGILLYHKAHYDDALELFQLAIDDNLNFWQAYQMAGYCQFEMRRKDEALKSFEDSLDINPGNPKLVKIYQDLKSGKLDVPIRPVATASTYYAAF